MSRKYLLKLYLQMNIFINKPIQNSCIKEISQTIQNFISDFLIDKTPKFKDEF